MTLLQELAVGSTAELKAAASEGDRNALKHGRYSAEAIAC
jgi:hypothetical protein